MNNQLMKNLAYRANKLVCLNTNSPMPITIKLIQEILAFAQKKDMIEKMSKFYSSNGLSYNNIHYSETHKLSSDFLKKANHWNCIKEFLTNLADYDCLIIYNNKAASLTLGDWRLLCDSQRFLKLHAKMIVVINQFDESVPKPFDSFFLQGWPIEEEKPTFIPALPLTKKYFQIENNAIYTEMLHKIHWIKTDYDYNILCRIFGNPQAYKDSIYLITDCTGIVKQCLVKDFMDFFPLEDEIKFNLEAVIENMHKSSYKVLIIRDAEIVVTPEIEELLKEKIEEKNGPTVYLISNETPKLNILSLSEKFDIWYDEEKPENIQNYIREYLNYLRKFYKNIKINCSLDDMETLTKIFAGLNKEQISSIITRDVVKSFDETGHYIITSPVEYSFNFEAIKENIQEYL